ncbi:MAG: AraC family transcriptional regulator [Halioglobus sp.]|nr:AraC family transcriptional regulator [Halioglobus sp.]
MSVSKPAIRPCASAQGPAATRPNSLPGRFPCLATLFALLTLFAMPLQADTDQRTLGKEVEDLKAATLQLNRDLFILEEELLFPDNTQVAVFLSLDVGEFFTLDAVKLTIDGVVVTNYLYTARQVDALRRGGVHRLYQGNLKAGEHEVIAVFTGRGPKGRDYRRATQLDLVKETGAKHLELKITDVEAQLQPHFSVREW